jgi:hypothetical protein
MRSCRRRFPPLYLDGVIEQMWFKLDAPGVVFLVNAESVDAAKTHVHGLRWAKPA